MELHELPNKAIFFAKGNCFLHKKVQKYGTRLHKKNFFIVTRISLYYIILTIKGSKDFAKY